MKNTQRMILSRSNYTLFLTAFFLFLLTGFTASAQTALTDHFVLKITTTTASESFTFYTQDTDYDIDWEDNDGSFEDENASGNQAHTFSTAGEHTIRFRNLNDIYINNQADKAKYTSIEQWGTTVWNADMGVFLVRPT